MKTMQTINVQLSKTIRTEYARKENHMVVCNLLKDMLDRFTATGHTPKIIYINSLLADYSLLNVNDMSTFNGVQIRLDEDNIRNYIRMED